MSPQYTTVGGYPNTDPHYISPEEEAAMEEARTQSSDSDLARRLDKETYDQKREHGFDAPDDAEVHITFGTLRKIEALLAKPTASPDKARDAANALLYACINRDDEPDWLAIELVCRAYLALASHPQTATRLVRRISVRKVIETALHKAFKQGVRDGLKYGPLAVNYCYPPKETEAVIALLSLPAPGGEDAREAALRIFDWDKRAAHVGEPANMTVSGRLVKDALIVARALLSLPAPPAPK